MKPTILLLLLISVFVQPIFASTNNTDEKFDLTPKIKKGDWFTIKFANRLEDYSVPVDSINYCAPIDLKQLTLKCEVIEITKKSLKLDFKFERVFVLYQDGRYYDSYFQRSTVIKNSLALNEIIIRAEINLLNDSVSFIMPKEDSGVYSYGVFSRKVDIKGGSMSSTEYEDAVAFPHVKYLIQGYLKDLQKQNYKIPLLSFGNLNIAEFKKYRILDSNLPIANNFYLEISGSKGLEIGTVDITTASGTKQFEFKEKHLAAKEMKKGKCRTNFYLPEQKLLALHYNKQKFEFVATPGDTIRLQLNPDTTTIKGSIYSASYGIQKYQSFLTTKKGYFSLNAGDMKKTNSIDSALIILNQMTIDKVNVLNLYRHNMSANWYTKQLKEIYYWAAQSIVYWHQKRDLRANYSELIKLEAFQNIDPLFDYYLKIEQYDSYLGSITKNSFRPSLESISTNQGYTRAYNLIESYEIYNFLYWGYPKYYILKDVVLQDLEFGGLARAQTNYDSFIENCTYPPFIFEVEEAFLEASKIEPGKSALNLDLNFIKHKNFNKNSEKYKIVHFGFPTQDVYDRLYYHLNHAISNLKLSGQIEIYFVYNGEFDRSSLNTTQKKNIFTFDFIEIESFPLYFKDTKILNMNSISLLILSPENNIIGRVMHNGQIHGELKGYIESQNQPKSHEGRNAMLLGAFITLLGTTLIAWLIIKISSRQIKKREAARRKLSELELKAIRSQMNPHFIFNAMGSIQNLINQNNTKNANLYLSSFAKLMRMVLTNSNKKLVSLADELELLKNYLELEQLRVDFQFNISTSENIDPETEEIPGMLVQPFVENAVIHGITPKGKGNISVHFSKKEGVLVCEIIDDGVGINTSGAGNGNGVAMKLAEKRLNLLNSQLQTKLSLTVENRMDSEKTSGTKITLLIPVG